MTGESDHMAKDSYDICMKRFEEDQMNDRAKGDKAGHTKTAHSLHEIPSPMLMSGTSISEGDGLMICTVVGDSSAIGIIRKTLQADDQETPL